MTKPIPLTEARKRKEAEREAELERKVIERWTGPMTDEEYEHPYQHCRCDACRKRWDDE